VPGNQAPSGLCHAVGAFGKSELIEEAVNSSSGKSAALGADSAFEKRLPIVSPEGLPGEEFVADVRQILQSRQLTNGAFVREFEAAAESFLGVPHCVAVSSCTSGLILVLQALGVRGEVILPSFTFHATAHSVLWNGLRPVFADCEPGTFCLDPAAVRAQLLANTAAILAVHLYGNPIAVTELEAIAAERGIPLICDAAHAFGTEFRSARVGSTGAAEVFSFSPTKLLVAGEGGMVSTRDPELARRLRAARNYGDAGTSDPELPGLNARMSEFHAALALRGLPGIDQRIARRNQIRLRYERQLGSVPGITFQQIRSGCRTTAKDFSLIVDQAEFGQTRDWLLERLLRRNIEVRRYFWPPVHRQKLYREIWDGRPLPVTEWVSDRVISLPIYSSLSDEDVDRICAAVSELASEAAQASDPQKAQAV
jgi:dTDP-4-amino-4,6-dideoxygalactose transaminase